MKLIGIPNYLVDHLYEAFKNLNNQERLLVVMYFLSEIPDEALTLQLIENNLVKVFPPSIKDNNLPKDYIDFQASVIRGQFNNINSKK
ncbi:hypothetical protein [Liberiplasma polymorphum]|uniref:hypothetical protein n=1 Tax=Liberiplasma polymorphum TaxID=3374570 RepID=UPI003772A82C